MKLTLKIVSVTTEVRNLGHSVRIISQSKASTSYGPTYSFRTPSRTTFSFKKLVLVEIWVFGIKIHTFFSKVQTRCRDLEEIDESSRQTFTKLLETPGNLQGELLV